jgi:hypothetical protein
MINIDYPPVNFKIREQHGYEEVWDFIRKKWIKLTPEEWVRQNFLNYLTIIKKYPASLIAVEKEITLFELKKRCDIVVYKEEKPWMIIECKELDTSLSHRTIEQVLRYNMAIPAKYLVVTNGKQTIGWKKENNQLLQIDAMPDMGQAG